MTALQAARERLEDYVQGLHELAPMTQGVPLHINDWKRIKETLKRLEDDLIQATRDQAAWDPF